MKLSLVFLALCMIAAASGRYATEITVKNARAELAAMKEAKAEIVDRRDVLRAEIAHLENPARLLALVRADAELAPLAPHQMVRMSRAIAIIEGRAQARPPKVLASAIDPFAAFANFDRTEPPAIAPAPDAGRDPAVISAVWNGAETL